MRKFLITAIIAGSMVMSPAHAGGAITFLTDFSNFSFFNGCSGESILTQPGSFLHGVFRADVENGIHIVNRSAGQVFARGIQSGEEYMINIRNEALPLANLPTGVNVVDGNGAINIVNSMTIIQPSNPGSGVFVAHVLIVLTQQDGVNVARVRSVTGECHSS